MSEVIVSKPLTQQGRDNWERIFKQKTGIMFEAQVFHTPISDDDYIYYAENKERKRCEALIDLLKKEENQ